MHSLEQAKKGNLITLPKEDINELPGISATQYRLVYQIKEERVIVIILYASGHHKVK